MASLQDDDRDPRHVFSELDGPERKALIQELIKLDGRFKKAYRRNKLALWFADINILRRADPLQEEPRYFLCSPCALASLSCADWARTNVSRSDERMLAYCPMTPPVRGPERDENAKRQTIIRDNQQCVLTKLAQPGLQVAYIIPSKLNRIVGKHYPDWPVMKEFWGNERVQAYKDELLESDGTMNTERVQNMMLLSSKVKEYWDNALCAFRPICVNQKGTSMELAFHWSPLPDENARRTEDVPTLGRPGPEHLQGFVKGPREHEEKPMKLFHQMTEKVIPSGFRFTITTLDPVNQPLPSMNLLQLKWNLSLIAAMQGEERD